MTDKGEAPQWMLFEVAEGLQRMIALSLPGTPAAETVGGKARAWADALWYAPKAWDQGLDAPRIAAAFQGIGYRLDRFPTPKAILEAMPPRPPQPALPEPEISEEQRRANLRRMAQIMTEALKNSKGPPCAHPDARMDAGGRAAPGTKAEEGELALTPARD